MSLSHVPCTLKEVFTGPRYIGSHNPHSHRPFVQGPLSWVLCSGPTFMGPLFRPPNPRLFIQAPQSRAYDSVPTLMGPLFRAHFHKPFVQGPLSWALSSGPTLLGPRLLGPTLLGPPLLGPLSWSPLFDRSFGLAACPAILVPCILYICVLSSCQGPEILHNCLSAKLPGTLQPSPRPREIERDNCCGSWRQRWSKTSHGKKRYCITRV